MVKIEIEKLIEILEKEAPKKIYGRILECINDEILKQTGEITYKYGCNSRYCPYCSNRLKSKEMQEIKRKLEKTEEKNYFLMTLNGNKVQETQLKREIESNNTAFNKLIRLKTLSDILLGYAKVTEVNYKKGRFKPHIHTILIFRNSYHNTFKLSRDKNILQSYWNKYKKSNGLEIDIQGVKSIDKVISYLTVSNKKKYLEMQPKEYEGIIKAIKDKKRLYSYGGILSNKKTSRKRKS